MAEGHEHALHVQHISFEFTRVFKNQGKSLEVTLEIHKEDNL